ncbi:MAG TPA: RlmE family RNA methyltransferase [Burkholderiales bacterium]|nr:RlmE family RNA methyltransferase [Burkholderiales bacterium]
MVKSSKAWLRRHVTDSYVRQARAAGYRSRSAYKLLEIDRKDGILRPGMTVLDLGAAPGGWSQVAGRKAGARGRVVAIDLLEIAPISGVTVLRGDVREPQARAAARAALGRKADLVLSDLSPNLSGIPAVDQARAAELADLAVEFALQVLQPSGVLLVKVFQGEAFEALLARARRVFQTVLVRKPGASRGESRETYLLGRGPKSALE